MTKRATIAASQGCRACSDPSLPLHAVYASETSGISLDVGDVRWRGDGGTAERRKAMADRLVFCWNMAAGIPDAPMREGVIARFYAAALELAEATRGLLFVGELAKAVEDAYAAHAHDRTHDPHRREKDAEAEDELSMRLATRARTVDEKLDAARRNAHTCHAHWKGEDGSRVSCPEHVPPEMLFCKRHWFMTPKKLRDEVWRTYRVGQCDFDPLPSREWHAAADAAICAVAEKEESRARREQA